MRERSTRRAGRTPPGPPGFVGPGPRRAGAGGLLEPEAHASGDTLRAGVVAEVALVPHVRGSSLAQRERESASDEEHRVIPSAGVDSERVAASLEGRRDVVAVEILFLPADDHVEPAALHPLVVEVEAEAAAERVRVAASEHEVRTTGVLLGEAVVVEVDVVQREPWSQAPVVVELELVADAGGGGDVPTVVVGLGAAAERVHVAVDAVVAAAVGQGSVHEDAVVAVRDVGADAPRVDVEAPERVVDVGVRDVVPGRHAEEGVAADREVAADLTTVAVGVEARSFALAILVGVQREAAHPHAEVLITLDRLEFGLVLDRQCGGEDDLVVDRRRQPARLDPGHPRDGLRAGATGREVVLLERDVFACRLDLRGGHDVVSLGAHLDEREVVVRSVERVELGDEVRRGTVRVGVGHGHERVDRGPDRLVVGRDRGGRERVWIADGLDEVVAVAVLEGARALDDELQGLRLRHDLRALVGDAAVRPDDRERVACRDESRRGDVDVDEAGAVEPCRTVDAEQVDASVAGVELDGERGVLALLVVAADAQLADVLPRATVPPDRFVRLPATKPPPVSVPPWTFALPAMDPASSRMPLLIVVRPV